MKRSDKVFLIDMVTAFHNQGDLLINRSLISNLRLYGDVKVAVAATPQEFVEKLELRKSEICRSTLIEVLRSFLFRELYIVGVPGHNFSSDRGYLRVLPQLAKVMLLRCFLAVRFLKVGNSIGPVSSAVVFAEKLKSYFCDLYGVRDGDSLALVNGGRLVYFPDLAFISQDILPAGCRLGEGYCFLSFRKYVNATECDSAYLEKVCEKLVSFFNRREFQGKVVVAFQVPSDLEACRMIVRAIEGVGGIEVEFRNRVLELGQAVELVRSARLVLSNRLHVLLPALIAGVPHVALTDIEKHSKVVSLYDAIGARSMVCDVCADTPVSVSRESNREFLRQIAQDQRQLALAALDDVLL